MQLVERRFAGVAATFVEASIVATGQLGRRRWPSVGRIHQASWNSIEPVTRSSLVARRVDGKRKGASGRLILRLLFVLASVGLLLGNWLNPNSNLPDEFVQQMATRLPMPRGNNRSLDECAPTAGKLRSTNCIGNSSYPDSWRRMARTADVSRITSEVVSS